jgi:endonuclease/exonuclease/phosphatase (EEP) superfamily protein YafD
MGGPSTYARRSGPIVGFGPSVRSSSRKGCTLTGFTAITYNLWHGLGERDLDDLVDEHRPDLLHLQEAAPGLPTRIGALQRVAMSSGGGYGVALFVRQDRFRVEAAAALHVPRSIHDRLMRTTSERLGAARILDEESGARLVVGSLHATPLTDPNAVRRVQIDAALRALGDLGPQLPVFLAGDLNYPHLTRLLDRHVRRAGWTVARSAVGTYIGRGPVWGAFDVALSRGLAVERATTLPAGSSDHRPVLFEGRLESVDVRARETAASGHVAD